MTPRLRSFAPRAVVDRRRGDVSADEVKAQDRPVTQPAAPWPAWIQLYGTGQGSDGPPELYQQLAAHCCGDHPAIQAKLTVGPPGDLFEREAERVADAVVQREGEPGEGEPGEGEPGEGEPGGEMVMPLLQRQPAEPEEGEEENSAEQAGELRARRTGSHVPPEVAPSFAGRLQRAQSGGEPLPAQTRASMEAAFGASFKAVRTHSDTDAAELSRTIGAAAFTHGTHIFLGANRLDPHGQDGRRLLAHELTHVIQQNPHASAPAATVMRAPAGVLQRDGQPGAGGGPPPEMAERQVLVYFYGDNDKPMGPIKFGNSMFSSLKPGSYKCVLTSDTITAQGRTERLHASEVYPGGWQELLGKTRRTVLQVTGDPEKPGADEEKQEPGVGEEKQEPGAGEEKQKTGAGGEPGPEKGKAGAGGVPGAEKGEPGAGGSKYGWLGLIHPPKWLARALDKTIEKLGLDKEILQIRALLTALHDLWKNRAELGSLFTMEKLLGVLFGIEGGTGIKALENWATAPAPVAPAAGGGAEKGGITDVTAKLVKILGVIRKVLQPIFQVRKAFTAVAAGIAAILDKVPLVEDLLGASAEERKTKDFEELIGKVADDVLGASQDVAGGGARASRPRRRQANRRCLRHR